MTVAPPVPHRSTNAGGRGSAPPVAVLGAGIAGLVAATELRREGVDVVVHEAGAKVAGMAESHADGDGFSYDTGAHFITNRLATALGMGAQCHTVERYGESVWTGGAVSGYPFGLMRRGRFVASAVRSRLEQLGRNDPPETATEWFRAEYGTALADEVIVPLIEAWSGAPGDQLSAAVGDKVPSSMLHTAVLKAAAPLTHRAVTIGYCREKPQSVHVWHVYPEGGVSTLCDKLASDLGDVVRLESPVEKVIVQDERVVAIRVNGRETEVAAVVSTAPINVLPRLVEGTTRLDRFAPFRFRPMVFANLRFEGRNLLPDVVMWVPSRDYPFFRLTEAPASMPWLAPEGKTMICVDMGTDVGSDLWGMDDETLGERCLSQLEELVPGLRRRYLGCRVVRSPIAYPVFSMDYETERQTLADGTGVEGLLSVGRNGEFDHILMEDIYWRTKAHLRRWIESDAVGETSARAPLRSA